MDVTFKQMKERPLAIEPVDVSKWFPPDGKMYVKELSAADSLRAAKEAQKADNDADWFSRCLCDKDGNKLIPDGETVDKEEMPAGLFKAVVSAALELSGFSVEDAEKNSPSPDDDSPSD